MPIDTSIYDQLGRPAVPYVSPMDRQLKQIAIQNALAQGTLNNQAIQGGALTLQQQQMAMQSRAALKSYLMGGASAPGAPQGPDGPAPAQNVLAAAPPSLDTDPSMGGAPLPAAPPPAPGSAAAAPPPAAPPRARPAVPTLADLTHAGVDPSDAAGLIEQFQKIDKGAADIDKVHSDTAGLLQEQIANVADAALKSNMNPAVISGLVDHFSSMGPQYAAMASGLVQKLQGMAPADQRAYLTALANQPKTVEANAAALTAKSKAAEDQSLIDERKQTAGIKAVQNLSALLASAPNEKARDSIMAKADPATVAAGNFEAKWSPGIAARDRQIGLTSQEQVTTAEAAKRDAQTAANERAHLSIEQSRLAIEQNKAKGALGSLTANDQAIAGKLATGDFNPALLGRMPNKEAIVAGAISLNPNWTPQVYEVKKSFKDGSDSTAIGGMARVLGHLESYAKNSADLGFSPTAAVGMTDATAAQTRLGRDTSAISEEFGKLVKANALTQGEADRYEHALNSSREGIRSAAVDEITNLMKAQFESKFQKYKTGTGQVLPVDQFFDQHTQGLLQSHGALPDGYVAPGAPAPGPAPVAAPAAAAPPVPHGIPELGSTFNGQKVLKVERVK